jgi:FMN reductase
VKSLSVVVGNPRPESRTLAVADAFANRLAQLVDAEVTLRLDLANYSQHLFTWPHDELNALSKAVQNSDFVVFATPTYKASYTALLKAFLDRYPNNGLDGVTAFPIFTIAAPEHALAVEFTLRPLLVELGASVPARGLAFHMSEMDRMGAQLDGWFEQNSAALAPHHRPAELSE